jgi:hypothetical protein
MQFVYNKICGSGVYGKVYEEELSVEEFFDEMNTSSFPIYGMDINLIGSKLEEDIQIPHFF